MVIFYSYVSLPEGRLPEGRLGLIVLDFKVLLIRNLDVRYVQHFTGSLKQMGIPGSTKFWIEPTTHGDMLEMT